MQIKLVCTMVEPILCRVVRGQNPCGMKRVICQFGTISGLAHDETCVCACVCVFFPFILDVRFVDVPAGVTQEEGHRISSTFLLRCMPFFFSREGFSRSFPSSTVKSNFVY